MTSVITPTSASVNKNSFHYVQHSAVHCAACHKDCVPFVTSKVGYSKEPASFCSISCYRRLRDARLFEQARKELTKTADQ